MVVSNRSQAALMRPWYRRRWRIVQERVNGRGDASRSAQRLELAEHGVALERGMAWSLARVRSRIISRSNSAKAPTICSIIRPAGVVASIVSVTVRKPAPASSIRSIRCRSSSSERESRSSFHTTRTSPGRSCSMS
jgi:hypothetical protein